MNRNFGLDVARVMAVTLVLLYHSFGGQTNILGYLGGAGWMGVDLFFVMSGFLVAQGFQKILEDGDARGASFRATLKTFYLKRAKRVIPAYFVTVAVVTLLTAPFPPLRSKALMNVPFFLTFTGNQVEILALVLWSISVEVQFYVVMPLIGLGQAGSRLADRVRRAPWSTLLAAVSIPVVFRMANYHLHPELVASTTQAFTPNIPGDQISTVFGKWLYASSIGHADGLLIGAWLGMAWRGRGEWLAVFVRSWSHQARGLGLGGFAVTYGMLAPWRTWMPRPWLLGVFGFTMVGLSALLLVVGLKTTLPNAPKTAWLKKGVEWGSDRIYSLYLGQAMASVIMSLAVAWSGLGLVSGLILTGVYFGITLMMGLPLYNRVESHYFSVARDARKPSNEPGKALTRAASAA